MKRYSIITIVFLLIAGLVTSGFIFGKKILNVKKIKIAGVSFSFPQLKNLSDFFLGFKAIAIITIGNYSGTKFTINQISVDVYTKEGNLIASQIEPLKQSIEVVPNSNSSIKLEYSLDYSSMIRIIQDSGFAVKDVLNILTKFITTKTFGSEIIVKGFVVAENVKLNIAEKIKI